MSLLKLTSVVVALSFLNGCGTVNNVLAEKTKVIEYYRIFDINTTADRYSVIDAASNGLGQNINSAKENTPIPDFSEAPDKPGRFQLVEPLKGTGFAALAAASGASLKMASCEGAVWIAQAERRVENSDTLQLTACLWEYKDGYHLDTYATFQKVTGGVLQLSRTIANTIAGTPEEWTEKTFLDIVRNIRTETGAQITYLEGYPKMQGTPWMDTGESI